MCEGRCGGGAAVRKENKKPTRSAQSKARQVRIYQRRPINRNT